jgi:NAD(P)-dependent dehydrogenase (short-subunit alcohol dehydrogenase family)
MLSSEETIIVTGASSGIGAAIVSKLSRPGRRVFATMRRPNLEMHGSDAIAMDVSSDESVAAAVATVLDRTGRIDAIVNNAGIDLIGAVEETTTDEALRLFQTNFFGVHRLTRAVLPTMRSQGHGRLVTIGSIGGFLPEPFQAFYSAAKHALEGYVESLDYEVRPFGVRALLIQPGFIRTSLSANRVTAASNLAAYASSRAHVMNSSAQDIGTGTPPEAVASAVEKLLVASNPALRTRVGADAHQLYLLRHILPPAFFSMGMRRRLAK